MVDALQSYLEWNVYNIEDTIALNLVKMKLDET